MKGRKRTPAQIISKLREAEVSLAKGQPLAKVVRKLGITEPTYDRWAYDLLPDRTHDGGVLRMRVRVDEYTRECLAIDVARRMTSEEVLERLAFLMATRGVPEHIRSDNGAEFTSQAVREWLAKVGVKTLFIEPGSPWENG